MCAMLLAWDNPQEKTYEVGCDRPVLYVANPAGGYKPGVAWYGVTNVTEKSSGAEVTDLYACNTTYLSIQSAEKFGGSIEAYAYPEEWEVCDGSRQLVPGINVFQQARVKFGMTYRTLIGSDAEGQEAGYRVHIFYGAQVSPTERAYPSINENIEPTMNSWEFSCVPVTTGPGLRPSALLTMDSRTTDPELLEWLEEKLYGVAGATPTQPSLPTPAEIAAFAATLA